MLAIKMTNNEFDCLFRTIYCASGKFDALKSALFEIIAKNVNVLSIISW